MEERAGGEEGMIDNDVKRRMAILEMHLETHCHDCGRVLGTDGRLGVRQIPGEAKYIEVKLCGRDDCEDVK